MNRLVIAAAVIALAAPLAAAQSSTWTPDPAHSGVSFSIGHMSISTVRGHFGSFKATIVINDTDVTKSTVNATIDVSSVDTSQSARDSDIKGATWFNVATYPTATFTSTSVTKSGDHLIVNGNLTLHGVTKPVVLDCQGPTGPITGMDHKPHAGFTATTAIKRTDFGIGSNVPAAMIGDDVKLNIDLEVVKQ
jgi:polyisoprenoid-binding protein YceI